MKTILFKAMLSSLVVAAPLAFASLSFAMGDLAAVAAHPAFWSFYLKSFSWLFVAGLLASLLTHSLVSSQRKGSSS